MNTNTPFGSAVGPFVLDYLAHMRALGRGYDREERVLRHLDAFLARTGADLSCASFSAWSLAQGHLSSGVRRNRMRIVRNMCLYRRRAEPGCFIPDITEFPANHQCLRPHIFTETEIVALLQAADNLVPRWNSPLCREVYRLAIVLLYTTGLRRGELVRLAIDDYEPYEHTLMIRESKFHKSRLLPLSADRFRELDTYLETRRTKGLPVFSDSSLLWNLKRGGNGYRGSTLGIGLRNLFRNARIRTVAGRLPRVHDLRHTFAVHAILRWYRSGQDVQAKLPFLSAYMGHVSVLSTQHYLHFIDSIAACASKRFAEHCSRLVVVSPQDKGGAR